MIRNMRLSFYSVIFSFCTLALVEAAEKTSVYEPANYIANSTYHELITEAAQNTLQANEFIDFMAVINEFPSKDSGEGKLFDADKYYTFRKQCSRVENYSFGNRALTQLADKLVYSTQYLAGFDLGYALNGIVGKATYTAKQNYYENL